MICEKFYGSRDGVIEIDGGPDVSRLDIGNLFLAAEESAFQPFYGHRLRSPPFRFNSVI